MRLVAGSPLRQLSHAFFCCCICCKIFNCIAGGSLLLRNLISLAAAGLLEILFGGIIAAVALALGLAFGLGGKDAAARYIEKAESFGNKPKLVLV